MKTIKHKLFQVRPDNQQDWQALPAVRGKSAYEIAVENGYTGTEAEWIHETAITNDKIKPAINDWLDNNKEVVSSAAATVAVQDHAPSIRDAATVWINPSENKNYNIPEIKDDEINAVDTWSSRKIHNTIQHVYNKTIDSYKQDLDIDYTAAFRRYFEDLKKGRRITLLINSSPITISDSIEIPTIGNTVIPFSICGLGKNTIINFNSQVKKAMFYSNITRKGYKYISGQFKDLNFIDKTGINTFLLEKGSSTSSLVIDGCVFNNWNLVADIEDAWGFSFIDSEVINGETGLRLGTANASRILRSDFKFLRGDGIQYYDTPNKGSSNTTQQPTLISNWFEDCVNCVLVNECQIDSAVISENYMECKSPIGNNAIKMTNNAILRHTYIANNITNTNNYIIISNCTNLTFVNNQCRIQFLAQKDVSNVVIISPSIDFGMKIPKEYYDKIYQITGTATTIRESITNLDNPPITINFPARVIDAHDSFLIYHEWVKDIRILFYSLRTYDMTGLKLSIYANDKELANFTERFNAHKLAPEKMIVIPESQELIIKIENTTDKPITMWSPLFLTFAIKDIYYNY